MKSERPIAFGAVLLVVLWSELSAADWPQWRHDANRSGATDDAGPTSAARLWEQALPYPDPAYDHQYRMCADVSHAPIAAGGTLFLPSNVSDEVMAIDLDNGKVTWRFFAEGPVRMAPVHVGGRVCFGSDDGYLYCVSGEDGALLWKVRGAPESLPESRMLINGRMWSRWPVRGAPVERDGVIFFGAGVWPEEGVYVCAVRAVTGEVIWRKDSLSYVNQGMSDHGRPYDLSLPPQGYLAHIDGKLAVPSGRSLASWFDPATGAMEPYTCFYVKHNPPRGTWYLAGIGRYCVQGGNWFGTREDAMPPLPGDLGKARSALYWSKDPPENELYVMRHRPFLNTDTVLLHNENRYTEPVLSKDVAYQSEFREEKRYLVPRGHTHVSFPPADRIVARDLARPRWAGTKHSHVAEGKKPVTMPRLEFPILWEMDSPLRALIKAGDQLFAGGTNAIAAIAIPDAGETPRVAWQAAVEGTPIHALVADGKLVVVTHVGRVICFGEGGKENPRAGSMTGIEPRPQASPKGGFAVVVGSDNVATAEVLEREDRRVIVLETDGAKADATRRVLAEKGSQGRRVQVLRGGLDSMGFTPYWASRVVMGSPAVSGAEEATLSAALGILRPHTGELRLAGGAGQADRIGRLLSGRSGYAVKSDGADLIVRREAPPEGAANWTHESGDAGNCFASTDRLVKWPLGVLWYSGDIDRYFTPASHFQHERNPYPLVIDGRMFIITGATIHCVDIYTGGYLWRAETPLTPYVKTRFFDSRQYGRPTDRNCAVAGDWLYVVTGDKVQAYDVETGEARRAIEIPARLWDQAHGAIHETQKVRAQGQTGDVQAVPEWTEVRLWDDLLIAMLGRHLTALDRHTGDLRWTRQSTRETTTCAIGGGTLYGFDCDVPKAGGGEKGKRAGMLFALDPRDGTVRWEKDVGYAPVPKRGLDLARPWLEPIQPVLAYNAKHGLVVLAVNRNDIQVFRGGDGAAAWSGPMVSQADPQRVYAPVVTEDYLLLSEYKGAYGYLFDILTGKEVGDDTAIPRPRTCARVIGNNNLLVYRDAATELYDIDGNRMIGLNSMRSGCTTSFIPAGGVMAAPMLGHGCVCNYPMFASVALHHMPELDRHRPESVVRSWVNQAGMVAGGRADAHDEDDDDSGRAAPTGGGAVDVASFRVENATVEAEGGGVIFRANDDKAGYALRRAASPMRKAVFEFTVRRAVGKSGEKRHGNAFFVVGSSDDPANRIECQLFYGGRSSVVITGKPVGRVEQRVEFSRQGAFEVTVAVDCEAGTVTMGIGEKRATARITGGMDAIRCYGYGGSNSDNLFSEIRVR